MKEQNKKAFVFYETFTESLENLPVEHQLKYLKYIINYGLHRIEPEGLSGFEKIAWDQIKLSIDNANKRYWTSVDNGKKGGAPAGNQNAKKQPNSTQNNPTEDRLNKNNLETTQNNPDESGLKKNNLEEEVEVDKEVDVEPEVDDENYKDFSLFFNNLDNGNNPYISSFAPTASSGRKNNLYDERKIPF